MGQFWPWTGGSTKPSDIAFPTGCRRNLTAPDYQITSQQGMRLQHAAKSVILEKLSWVETRGSRGFPLAMSHRIRPTVPISPKLPKPGRGAAWIARLTGGQKVAGSNPVAPTCKAFRSNELRKAFSMQLLGGTKLGPPRGHFSEKERKGRSGNRMPRPSK